MTAISLRSVSKSYTAGTNVLRDVSFDVKAGEFLVIVGPSGCGKSTLLRMIAGLESITSGDLLFDDKRMNEVAAKDRDVGMVFQNYALYPHLTVSENIAFPLSIRKINKSTIASRVKEVATMLQLEKLLDRRPKELSGGQRQRVALGRAIARNPKCFLFDEPLSNLDAQLRNQMREEILALHKKVRATSVYVTHDQTEAMTMGDRIVVLNNGVLQQLGTPHDIYHKPENTFVAGFVGTPAINKIQGKVRDNFFCNDDKSIVFSAMLKNFDQVSSCAFRPEDISIDENSSLKGEIKSREYIGHETILVIDIGGNKVTVRENSNSTYSPGEIHGVTIHTERVLFFDEKQNLIRA